MKLHQFLQASLFASSLAFLVSCDSGGADAANDIASNQEDRAKVLDALLAEDVITVSATSGIDTPENFWFSAQGTATVGVGGLLGGPGFTLEYNKVGHYTFQYLGVNLLKQDNYIAAINSLLGDPSAIGSAFRLNLLDSGSAIPSFNRAKLQRIADDLYDAGSLAYLHPTKDVVFVLSNVKYVFTSTSTNRNLVRGQMAGTYNVTATGSVVTFRRPSSQELSSYNSGIRGITPSHWIPVLSLNAPTTLVENFEIGDYDLLLTNIPTVVTE